jgi:hypothetical protein
MSWLSRADHSTNLACREVGGLKGLPLWNIWPPRYLMRRRRMRIQVYVTKPAGMSSTMVEYVLTSFLTFRPAALEPLIFQVEARAGIEPAHTGFADQCITTLLPRHSPFSGAETRRWLLRCQLADLDEVQSLEKPGFHPRWQVVPQGGVPASGE